MQLMKNIYNLQILFIDLPLKDEDQHIGKYVNLPCCQEMDEMLIPLMFVFNMMKKPEAS